MKIVLVGGGASNIFLALQLIQSHHEVHLYEKTKGIGKKFLVAGKSDLNITHSENIKDFSKRYFENDTIFFDLFKDFSNQDLINWLDQQNIKTFTGSSKRVFPKDIKASAILKKWSDLLKEHPQFHLYPEHELTNIQQDYLEFNHKVKVTFDKVIYALGGASWKKTGSSGDWIHLFKKHHIKVYDFYPTNCGYELDLSQEFLDQHQRKPLKNIALSFKDHSIRGELMLTEYGIEGTPIYSLSNAIHKELKDNGQAVIYLDLKPDLTSEQIQQKLNHKKKNDSLTRFMNKTLKFDKSSIDLIKKQTSKDEFQNELAYKIKKLPLIINKPRPIDEAISSGGGVAMDELTDTFELKKLPHHYCIGEMMDWNTITGGYLLQGCFSQAYRVSDVISTTYSTEMN